MSPEAKKLKLTGIVTMFVGLAALVAGIVLAVMAFDVPDVAVILAGLATAFLGARAARVANVPSTAGKLLPAAGGITCVDAATVAGSAFLGGDVANVVVCAAALVFAAVVIVVANGVKKALEKI